MTAQRLRAGAVAGAVIAVVTACGVPTGGGPTILAASDVPYGLASPATPTPTQSTEPEQERAWIYLVGPDDALVPRGRDLGRGSLDEMLDELLAELAAGPTSRERTAGLATALPPGLRLAATGVEDGTATVDFSGPVDAPAGRAGRQLVAQVVLSTTTLPGVDSVLLTSEGDPVEAPLPSGELTDSPLLPADYAVFLTPPPLSPSPSPPPAPGPDEPPFPADTRPDTAEPSPDAAVTVTDIRIGRHDGFDRVVIEIGGTGIPGWDVRYVDDPRSQGSGEPVEVDGAAVLQVGVTGIGLPTDTGVPGYAGTVPVSAAGTAVLTEVVFDGIFEGTTMIFAGASEAAPFRVYLLQAPTRVVLEVVG